MFWSRYHNSECNAMNRTYVVHSEAIQHRMNHEYLSLISSLASAISNRQCKMRSAHTK